MLANLDRDQFIVLLRKLGEEEDETVLAAARDLHAQITVAGIDWDDLLVPEEEDEPEDEEEGDLSDDVADDYAELDDDEDQDDDAGVPDHDAEADEDDSDDDSDNDEDERALTDAEKTEATSLIEKLLEKGVSASTKSELEEYKIDLVDGDFVAMDLRYLRALHKRLSK